MPRVLLPTLAAAALFAAGGVAAQTCTMSGWSATTGSQGLSTGTPDSGHRRYDGHCGLKVRAEQQPRYVEDDSPEGEIAYYARFYFFAGDLELDEGDWVDLFTAYQGESRPSAQLAVRLQQTGDGPAIVLRALDGGRLTDSESIPIRAGWHGVTLQWSQASGPPNGEAVLALDGRPRATLAGLDNRDNRIDLARLGSVQSRGVQGELFFDAFESRRKTPVDVLLRGDASGDEVLDAADLVALVDEINGRSLAAGQPDCNGDGSVDRVDLTCLADEIVNR